ncbi:serum response factor homolog [Harmonia axyridis]|uniref:serum response factor homolog n=1 Tax=Harmonia axyridis TaxID=115357 RepID=UPI001E278401|nr:serum response factor homolog [Harmonia axyridis]
MEPPGGRDSRFNMSYSMNLLSGETPPEIYGNPNLGRPSTSLQQLSPRHTMVSSACGGRGGMKNDVCYDDRGMSSQGMGLESCVNDMNEDTYNSLQSKKSPPSNGKKTKGRVKIKMEYIENKLRRYTTFSKRKTGIMKKAYELSTLTGTQVMLLVASETGHVYTFATRKLQPMITSEAGKALIQTCLNSPDPPAGSASGDQRMSATGFEETELTYNISDEDSKDENMSGAESSGDSSDGENGESENPLQLYIPPEITIKPTNSPDSSHPPAKTSRMSAESSSTSTSYSSANNVSSTSTKMSSSTATSSTNPPPLISPLVYQTPQGMMYAQPNGNGVLFSLAHTDPNSNQPQFITIPLSMVTANGQGELDLSKRKTRNPAKDDSNDLS